MTKLMRDVLLVIIYEVPEQGGGYSTFLPLFAPEKL